MFSHTGLRNFSLALILMLALAFGGAVPALAATQQSGDQVCTGNNITVGSGQSVGNILAFGCNVEVQQGGTVNGSIADFGGNVQIAGTVNGSIATFGGNVLLTETAMVNGQVATMGGNYSSAPGAVVRGRTSTPPIAPIPPIPPTPPVQGFINRQLNFGFDILGGIITALAFAALGALVVIFAPNATKRVSSAVQAKPLNTAGVGCLTLIVFPILAILLVITLIGIPIAFLLGVVTWAAWIFGGIAIGLLAGEKILGALKVKDVLPVIAVMLGIVLLMLIGQIPILGWLVSCVLGLIGLGAVVMTRFGTRPYPPAPSMALVPAAAAASNVNAPNAYTPSDVDIAAWEARAREAQAREKSDAPTAPSTNVPMTNESPAQQDKPIEPPKSDETNTER